jgi:hypothetical protein
MIHLLLTTTLMLAVAQDPPPPSGSDEEPAPAEQVESPDQEKDATPPAPDTPPKTAKEVAPDAEGSDAKAALDAARTQDEEGKPTDAEGKKPAEAQVEENYREAMRTYQGVFSQESSMDLQNVRTRIAANEKLVADHSARLTDAEGRLRALRTGFDRKVMAARQGQKDGKIPQATFDRLLAEQKEQKASQERELEGDIVFYRQEVAAARARLVDLRSRNRMLSFDADLNGGKKPAHVAPALQDEILAKFQKLNRFELRPIPLPYHDARGGCGECRDCVLGNKGR